MRSGNMKGYGTLMFLLAGVVLLVFTGRMESKRCMLRREEGERKGVGIEAVIVDGADFTNLNHKWLLCNVSVKTQRNEILWMCDFSSDDEPTELVTKKFNWSSEVHSIVVCQEKAFMETHKLKATEAQLEGEIAKQKKENKDLQLEGVKAYKPQQRGEGEIKSLAEADSKIWKLTNESARLDTLMEKEVTECKKKKHEVEEEYDRKLAKAAEEVENVKKAIELKEQQLEKLGINRCPACDAGTCWDDVKIRENLDKLYGKDGWTKSGGKCGVSHEGTEGNHSKYNENMSIRKMQILFGVLLLISCSTVWADDNTCYCTKETGEVYREESTNAVTKFILRGGDKFFDTEKTWMFCDASQHDTQFKLWSCNSRKTMKELVGNNAILRKEVEASNLCESTIASQKEEHVQNIGKLQTELRELQTERENIKRKVNKQEKEQEKIEQDIQKLNKLNEIITELQTRNSKKQKKLENEVQQCDNNITNHFIKPKEEILQKINVSLHDLKEQLNSMTQMFEEGIKKSNCSVCSANICYSTPSVKAELDKKYLENSWLNLTAAQREQCPLDDTMLLPMLSYMRRKPFDGAYAHNQYVNMMEKLFALVISFFCFFI